jgi:hypothetical protein
MSRSFWVRTTIHANADFRGEKLELFIAQPKATPVQASSKLNGHRYKELVGAYPHRDQAPCHRIQRKKVIDGSRLAAIGRQQIGSRRMRP